MFVYACVRVRACVCVRVIEIEKERMASSKLTREIVYEKKAAKYEGAGRFAHKLCGNFMSSIY